MSKQIQARAVQVPPALIEARGVYAGETDLIGKAIRITKEPQVHPLARLLGMATESPLRVGAEGTVVHVSADGLIWADFGDDERADVRNGPDGPVRIYDVGHVDGESERYDQLYELAE